VKPFKVSIIAKMNGQNYYPSAAPTAPAGQYFNPPPVYAPATTTSLPYYNYYPNGGLSTSTTTVPTTTSTVDGAVETWSNGAVCTKRDQAAIISLGVICGLLAIGIAILLFLLFRRRREQGNMEGELVISPGYGKHKHRRDRTVYSRGATDDMTDYLYTSRKHRGHRRSQPVTSQEFAGVQRPAMAAQWGNAGSPAAYAHLVNGGAPLYFQAGQGGGQAVPVVPMPAPAPQPREVDILSGTEQSDVSSRSDSKVPRRSSVRRNQSRTSSSQGTRSGRR
jgi:hypothetical protein